MFNYFLYINFIAFCVFALDKKQAIKEKYRIRERTLFILVIAGGSIGALLAMKLFHHKTKKFRFKVGIPVILSLQIVAFLCIMSRATQL